MSDITQVLVSPRYRHFVPEAPPLTVKMPALKKSGPKGGIVQVQIVSAQQTLGQREYVLDNNFKTLTTGLIHMYINGVYQANNFGFFGTVIPSVDEHHNLILDANGKVIVTPLMEFQLFTFDPESNTVTLTNRAATPAEGASIRFENLVDSSATEGAIIPMKQYTLQGASPVDATIINPLNQGALYFQGAYRCTLELLSAPKHGVVKISDDTFNFEYRPELGYHGDDYFAYRIVNCMGQESPLACVTLKIGSSQ